MSMNVQDRSIYQQLQAALIERCLLVGNIDFIPWLFASPAPTATGATVPDNSIGGPPVGWDIQSVGWWQNFQETIETLLTFSVADTAVPGGWRIASQDIDGMDASSNDFTSVVYSSFSSCAHDAGLGPSGMPNNDWRRKRPREARGTLHIVSGSYTWTPEAGGMDTQMNFLSDGMKAWIVGTGSNSMLAKYDGASGKWLYIGQDNGDLPDCLDSNLTTDFRINTGVLQAGDYIGQWLVDDLKAVMTKMTEYVVQCPNFPLSQYGTFDGYASTADEFGSTDTAAEAAAVANPNGPFGPLDNNNPAGIRYNPPNIPPYPLFPGAVAGLKLTSGTWRATLFFTSCKYGAVWGHTAADWLGFGLPAGVVSALPNILGNMNFYVAVGAPGVISTYPSWIDLGDPTDHFGGNGLPGWAAQNQYKSVESIPMIPVDGTLYKTSEVGNGHSVPSSPDWASPGRKGWIVVGAIIEYVPSNFSFP